MLERPRRRSRKGRPFREAEKIREYAFEAIQVLSKECSDLKTNQVQQYILVKYGLSFDNRELGSALGVLTRRGLIYCTKGTGRKSIWHVNPQSTLAVKYEQMWVSVPVELSVQLVKISKITRVPKSYIVERMLVWGLKDYLKIMLEEHQGK